MQTSLRGKLDSFMIYDFRFYILAVEGVFVQIVQNVRFVHEGN